MSEVAPAAETLLSDFPRGDPDRFPQPPAMLDGKRRFTMPAAEFMSPVRMRHSRLRWREGEGKLFLGVIDGTRQTDNLGRPFIMGGHAIGVEDDRHMLTFAGSRAGKGRSVIVPNMLHYPGSVLATDPKGELATMTARRRKSLGQAVHVLDPFGVTAGAALNHLAGFNPIAAMRGERRDAAGRIVQQSALVEDAALIADALVVVEGTDPHWDESARALIEGVILHVRTSPLTAYKNASLLTVRNVIGRMGNRGKDGAANIIQAEMEMNEAAGGVIQSAAADFFDRPDNERGSVLSSARRHLKFVDMFRDKPQARMTLETHSFELDALKTRATTIYLCLPARHMGTCNRWLRLFVNLTLQSMELVRVKTMPGNVPVLCVLDEFATLGHLKQIEDAAGQIAGFGVKLWPILQDMGQLQSLYRNRWETFVGNAGVLQFFGNNDLATLEWISKRCGRTSVELENPSLATVTQRMGGGGKEARQTTTTELLTIDEAARLFGRRDLKLRQLVIWADLLNPLMVMQRAYYDKHALFHDAAGRPLYDLLDA